MSLIKTKTIICKAEEYDLEFEKWQLEVQKTLKSFELISSVSVSHDGNNHYITYQIKWNLPKNI